MKDKGYIEKELLKSGRTRWRIVMPDHGAKRVLGSQTFADGVEVAFPSFEEAEGALTRVRGYMLAGNSVLRAFARIRPRALPEDLVENRVAEYVAHFRRQVDAGQRSDGTLVGLLSYSGEDRGGTVGAWSYWYGRSARDITYAAAEDWHAWLSERGLAASTQLRVSNLFKAVLGRLAKRREISELPAFPKIEVAEHVPEVVTMSRRERVFEAIPYERRGSYLIGSCLLMRPCEVFAVELGDYDPESNTLLVNKAVTGRHVDEKAKSTKKRTSNKRPVWDDDARDWILWRLEQTTAQQKLRGEATALFWNPTARNKRKRWNPQSHRTQWNAACKEAGVRVKLYEGTKHSTATALAEGGMSPLVLKALGGWQNLKSVEKYAKPRVTRALVLDAKRRGGT